MTFGTIELCISRFLKIADLSYKATSISRWVVFDLYAGVCEVDKYQLFSQSITPFGAQSLKSKNRTLSSHLQTSPPPPPLN